MTAAAIVLLLAMQTPTLDSIDGLDKPVTIRERNALVKPVLLSITKPAGLTLDVPADIQNYKVTVFAKDTPGHKVLDAIADVYGLRWVLSEKRLLLRTGKGRTLAKQLYDSVNLMLHQRRKARLAALAAETRKPFAEGPKPPPPADPTTETPTAWAKRMARQPAYYVLGVLQRKYPTREQHFVHGSFMIAQPPNQRAAAFPATWIDENSAALDGTQIVFRYLNMNGELQAATVNGGKTDTEISSLPYPYAAIPDQLKKTHLIGAVEEYEATLDAIPEKVRKKALEPAKEIANPGYFTGKYSLAEKLENLHNRSGLTIVADAYRIPILGAVSPEAGTTVDLIEDLRKAERCFTRWHDDVLRVRHPGFWTLREWEPNERVLLQFEALAAKGPLTIANYVALAPQLEVLHVADHYAVFDRFLTRERTLVKFDPSPLVDAFPALYAFGKFSGAEQKALIEGRLYTAPHGQLATRQSMFMAALFASFHRATWHGRIREAMLYSEPVYLQVTGLSTYWNAKGHDGFWRARTCSVPSASASSMQIRFGYEPDDYAQYDIQLGAGANLNP